MPYTYFLPACIRAFCRELRGLDLILRAALAHGNGNGQHVLEDPARPQQERPVALGAHGKVLRLLLERDPHAHRRQEHEVREQGGILLLGEGVGRSVKERADLRPAAACEEAGAGRTPRGGERTIYFPRSTEGLRRFLTASIVYDTCIPLHRMQDKIR